MKEKKLRKFKYRLVNWKRIPGKQGLERILSTEKTIFAKSKKDARAQLAADYRNKEIIFGSIKKETIKPKKENNEITFKNPS